MQVLLISSGGARLAQIARALQNRNELAGLWVTEKNRGGIPADKFRRCWLYHLAMKPFYHLAPMGLTERMSLRLFPLWTGWVRRQKPPPADVVHAIMGHATEPFDLAEKIGALKVLDAGSSHPTSYFGFWQRECDLWCPGARVGIPRWLFARCNRELERADVILCSSTFVKESMLYNSLPESKCVLSPYGVDTSLFTARTVWPEKPRFICVGAICLRKGHQYLFRAFEKVRRVLPDAELVCVGGYYPDFKRERPRWHGTFTHYERVGHEELSQMLRAATAFVFPSNEEGFAKAILEAMAAGLPIIATHQSGATTLVRDGSEGWIVGARDVDALAAAMIQAATDRNANEKMGAAARARGAANNAWSDYTGRLIETYRAALQKRTMPARKDGSPHGP